MNKLGSLNLINLITGITIISGGFLVIFNFSNLGFILAILGSLIKAIESLAVGGLR